MSPSFYLFFSLSASPFSVLHPLLDSFTTTPCTLSCTWGTKCWPTLPPGLQCSGFYLSSDLFVDKTLAERWVNAQHDAPLKHCLLCFALCELLISPQCFEVISVLNVGTDYSLLDFSSWIVYFCVLSFIVPCTGVTQQVWVVLEGGLRNQVWDFTTVSIEQEEHYWTI